LSVAIKFPERSETEILIEALPVRDIEQLFCQLQSGAITDLAPMCCRDSVPADFMLSTG
jgi:hypothetical protein